MTPSLADVQAAAAAIKAAEDQQVLVAADAAAWQPDDPFEAVLLDVGENHVELLAPLGSDTPVGKFLGALSSISAGDLGAVILKALVERTANDTGPYLARGLAALASHPLVGQARSLGLIGAVEIVAPYPTCCDWKNSLYE